jgi:hypothetical protein
LPEKTPQIGDPANPQVFGQVNHSRAGWFAAQKVIYPVTQVALNYQPFSPNHSVIPGRPEGPDPESILRSVGGYGFRVRGP